MKKVINLLIFVPLAIVLIVLSVANRKSVQLSLDPFNTESPALSFSMPFFVFLFLALLAGMLIGSAVTWFRQGKYRRELRDANATANRLKKQVEDMSGSKQAPAAEIAPGLPMVTQNRDAA